VVAVHRVADAAKSLAGVIAHETGHLLGFAHDVPGNLAGSPLADVAESQRLIRNGTFSGTVSPSDWATSGAFHADSRFSNYHNSAGYGYLSNADGSPGNNLIGEMSQQFTVPSNATTALLTYWYYITSQDKLP